MPLWLLALTKGNSQETGAALPSQTCPGHGLYLWQTQTCQSCAASHQQQRGVQGEQLALCCGEMPSFRFVGMNYPCRNRDKEEEQIAQEQLAARQSCVAKLLFCGLLESTGATALESPSDPHSSIWSSTFTEEGSRY